MAASEPGYFWAIAFPPFITFLIWSFFKVFKKLVAKEKGVKLTETILSFIMAINFMAFSIISTLIFVLDIYGAIFFILLFTIGCSVFYFSLRALITKTR